METGSSAGSRPKSALWLSADGRQASSVPREDFQPWLLKFSSSSLPLGLDEGVWEAAALTCAQRAGIATSNWRLFSGLSVQGKPVQWLGMKRFDRTARGRMYFVSAAGLLDADFRQPSLDYEQLVRLALWLTQSHTEVMEMLRRAIFNFFLGNMDDHAKNFGFLLDDQDRWHLAPAFDITFSPNRYGEHATSFAGAGRALTKDAVEQMRRLASLSAPEMHELGEKVAAAVETFVKEGEALGASKKHVREIAALVNRNLQENSKALGL